MTSSNSNNVKFLLNKSKSKNTQQVVYDAQINIFSEQHPAREPLEKFIKQVFQKHYNVELEHFYPKLLAIESLEHSQNNIHTIKAVAGVRCASEEYLFSEYYLSKSLETELQSIYHTTIDRRKVVEVGNLAPANVGQMRWLIAAITAYLFSAGYEYLVFTAVPSIYNSFQRMDMPVTIINEARPDCLPEDIRQHWGDEYYSHKPVVIAGDIVQGFKVMQQNIYQKNKKIIPLFEKACRLGEQSLSDSNDKHEYKGLVA